MREINSDEIRGLATDIEVELKPLKRLEGEIRQVQAEIQQHSELANFLYESLALKLHNFYNGCERIFRLIASDLNGALPTGQDWHRRLLSRMSMSYRERPAVLTSETVRRLQEYLAFRHVVRNLYGFELEPQRLQHLVTGHFPLWHRFETEVREFVNWLRTLADQLEAPE
ncbi:MAG: hypothetical protein O7E52_00440 [Candidatus Poribacteria bacterium]|nr:hypothetical protein [Candidatus Poribacteria bacterium]